jgi:hypothetical protein
MKSKQTAVEWLQDQFRAFGTITDSGDERTHQLIKSAIDMCEQAKAMEKEQIMLAHLMGFMDIDGKKTEEQYYNETYGTTTTTTDDL